jgi:intracellular septation protein
VSGPGQSQGQWKRTALDLGPLLLFGATFGLFGIYVATGVFMAAACVALALGYMIERRLSPMPIATAILVLIAGGLTLYLKNDTFIKIKPTVLYASFGTVLIGGLAFNRLFIKYLFATTFQLDEDAWRSLTWRFGSFFFALAILNEIVWRNFSTATWVWLKVAGFLPLTLLFALAQVPFLLKHHVEEEQAGS